MIQVQSDGNLDLLRQFLDHFRVAPESRGLLDGHMLREEHHQGRRVGCLRGIDHGPGHYIVHTDESNHGGVALLSQLQDIGYLLIHGGTSRSAVQLRLAVGAEQMDLLGHHFPQSLDTGRIDGIGLPEALILEHLPALLIEWSLDVAGDVDLVDAVLHSRSNLTVRVGGAPVEDQRHIHHALDLIQDVDTQLGYKASGIQAMTGADGNGQSIDTVYLMTLLPVSMESVLPMVPSSPSTET